MENRQSRLETKVQVLDEAAVKRALMRISYEIVEKCADVSNLVLVGIRTRGVPIAEVIAENIQKNSGVAIPVGSLDITFYRDDLEKIDESPKLSDTKIDANINGKGRPASAKTSASVCPRWESASLSCGFKRPRLSICHLS